MEKLKKKIKFFSATAIFCLSFLAFVFIVSLGAHIVRAAYEEPTTSPPEGNIFVPLDISRNDQAKKGNLMLNPLYNPYGSIPQINFPLEVAGPNSVYINDLQIPEDADYSSSGSLLVDTDTLYVQGLNDQVGIGTLTPATLLEVVGGGISVGSNTSLIDGTAITSSSSTEYGIDGTSIASSTASVYGQSTAANGVGVYGLNLGGGTGIRAESSSASAVVGISSAAHDPSAAIKVAGIFGQARGLGSWAGYFAQRVYSSEHITGRKFVPNRLQYSQVPYTAGWEMRTIDNSKRIDMYRVTFDGTYLWVFGGGYYGDMYLVNPLSGTIVDEFSYDVRQPEETIYAGGYIWSANSTTDTYGITRVETASPYNSVDYDIGSKSWNADVKGLVYDDVTNPGTPYIWSVVQHTDDYSYLITRLDPSGPTINSYTLNAGSTCTTLDTTRCSDGIDNDGDTFIDTGVCSDPSCDNQTDCEGSGAGQCSATWTLGDAECLTISQAPGTDSSDDERLVDKELGWPTGIDFDGTYLWVSFQGRYNDSINGAGVARILASNPATQDYYCIGPARGLEDIAYDSVNNYVWLALNPHYSIYQGWQGIARLDPVTYPAAGSIVEYSSDGAGNVILEDEANIIKFDNLSGSDGVYSPPYVWASNKYRLVKFDTGGTLIYSYGDPDGLGVNRMPEYLYDFTFDRNTTDGPYVWGAHYGSDLLSRNEISSPHSSKYFIPRGSKVSDIVFDGTYIWAAVDGSNIISKYRAADGVKIGDYQTGWNPHHMFYDGVYIWTVNIDPNGLTRINAATGERVGDYSIGNEWSIDDVEFDGENVWISKGYNNELWKINLDTCITDGTCDGAAKTIFALNDPRLIVYDGQFLWVSHSDNPRNTISKVDPADGSELSTVTIPGFDADANILALEYDGTYLWVGTYYVDDEGNSVYKIDPSDGTLVGKYALYHDPGICQGGDNSGLTCFKNNDCPGGGSCNNITSNVRALGFDGINIWVEHGFISYAYPSQYRVNSRECNDGVDNDGDGLTDYVNDPECNNDDYDMHESDTGTECSDGLDNDGNGLCDYDGAVGFPGCSGKPDPGCVDGNDISEATITNESYLTRIEAATGRIVESINYNSGCEDNTELIFDGTHIWFSKMYCPYTLYQYYSGSGLGLTDLAGSATLYSAMPSTAQAGSFTTAGEANFGADLSIVGDLVIQNNTWGGSADNLKDFGDSCADGEFVKGVDIGSDKLQCRPL